MIENINIDELISKTTKEAIREYEKEKRREQKNKVFHNTKLLMKHYNELKKHVENAIDDVSKLETDLLDINELDRDEIFILSIKKSKAKTLVMIAHIDMCMNILRKRQYKLCCKEKFDAMRMFYIGEMSYEEIQEHLCCGKNTPGRWIKEMTNELGILLFGIDGLKLDVV